MAADKSQDRHGDEAEQAAELSFQNDLGEARTCDCGGINLTIGPMTLHFAADEADALFELVAGGLDLLGSATQVQESRPATKARRMVH